MATRRDQDLPSHPSTSPGGRPRIPEREITTTDVTQHATEVLTDQDFVITAPSEGDYFRHDGDDWVNVPGIPAGDIPEGHVTQHQAALSIAESQIDNGTLLARLGDDDTITGDWTFEGLLKTSRTGEHIRLDDTSGSGTPSIGFYQDGTQRVTIAYSNSASALFFRNHETGVYRFATNTGGTLLEINDFNPFLRITATANEAMRITHTSPSGSPFISFFQDGNRAGTIQFHDGDNSMRVFNDFGNNFWDFRSNGDFVAEGGDVIATV